MFISIYNLLFVGKNKTIQKYIEIFFIMWRKSIYNENVKENTMIFSHI